MAYQRRVFDLLPSLRQSPFFAALAPIAAAVAVAGCFGVAQPERTESAEQPLISPIDPIIIDPPIIACPTAPKCDPTVNVDIRPSLVITQQERAEMLEAHFSLAQVLTHLLSQVKVTNEGANELYQRLWDTQNTDATGVFQEVFAPHCDDNQATINGFPVSCPRPEGALTSTDPSLFIPVALFNRFDLAPADGSHCGEYRIVYAMTGGSGRNFIIFEGQLPNPTPECGIESCRPVAEHWAKLTGETDDATFEKAVVSFYYDGLPGFGPVITPANYGLGAQGGQYGRSGGQVRTNQFGNSQQWQLREFQLDRQCFSPSPEAKKVCKLIFKPVSVKANPFGDLFDSSSQNPLASSFQSAFVAHGAGDPSEVEALALANHIMGLGLTTDEVFNAGQSTSQPFSGDPDNYVNELGSNNSFSTTIQSELTRVGSPLTPQQIARRALTQSCAGCHQLSRFQNSDLGGGIFWPPSRNFVHVDEFGFLSTALECFFLPHREAVLEQFLRNCGPFQAPACTSGQTQGGCCGGNKDEVVSMDTGTGFSSEGATLGGSTTH